MMGKDLGISIEEKVHRIKAYLDETLTPEEEAEFRRWLSASVANRVLLDRIRDERILLNKIRFSLKNNKGKGWGNIQKKIRKRPNVFVRFMRYAAVLVAIVLVSVTVYQVVDYPKEDDDKLFVQEYPMPIKGGYKAYLELTTGERLVLDTLNKVIARVEGAMIKTENAGTVIIDGQKTDSVMEKSEYNRLVIPRGGEYKLVMADGTTVWLNSESSLKYPVRFAGERREVWMEGEVCFDVAENKEHPFVVHVDKAEVKVLGTLFNVEAYPGEETITTTLVRGKVQVTRGEESRVMEPDEQVVIEGERFTMRKVVAGDFVRWTSGVFSFSEASLESIMDKLARWYDVEVFFSNASLKDLHITLEVRRYENIADILAKMEKMGLVRFDINNRTIVVRE